MADEGTTKTDIGSSLSTGSLPEVPLLIIAHHPEPALLGQRCVVPDGDELVLGRTCDHFGPNALRHNLVSRHHVRVTRSADAVTVADLGSRNGTFINGVRTSGGALRYGDVLSVGPVLLVLNTGPLLDRRAESPALVGVSSAHARVVEQIERAATDRALVLIQGETGVGKELVATELHRQSGVPGRFVALNCGAVADGVVHSELFGHARGAFSGAGRERSGLVRAASRGTLFLDEIGDASPTLQASLLRLLEQREYRSVGSDRVLRTDARFVAATHVPLEPAVAGGAFRRDLYGRLNRWVITVPALRERPEDIVPLARHFAYQRTGQRRELSRSLALALLRYAWPSNVRELRAVMEQVVVEAGEGAELEPSAALLERLSRAPAAVLVRGAAPLPPTHAPLPFGADTETAPDGSGSARTVSPARPPAPRRERPAPEQLRARLEALDYNVRALADELGVSRRTAYRWFEDAGIDLHALRSRSRQR